MNDSMYIKIIHHLSAFEKRSAKLLRSSFVIFTAILLVFPAFVNAQDAQEWYQRGLTLKSQGKIDEAIKAFGKAIGRNRNFTEPYYEMALLYQSKKSSSSLKRATDTLLDAMRIEPENVKLKTALGNIYMDRTFFADARKMYERALEIDANDLAALGGLAQWHTREVSEYEHRVDYDIREILLYPEEAGFLYDEFIAIRFPKLWDKNLAEYARKYGGSSILPKNFELVNDLLSEIVWDEFVALDDSAAKALNRHVLTVNPDDRDALYRLGLNYFESDSLRRFAEMFENLVSRYPGDKDGHLFLGLAYFRSQEYDKAYVQFETAKSLMSEEERAVFANVGYMKVGGFKEETIRNSEIDTTKFWYQRDPMYFTPYNEREMEHYSRVTEANLRYSVPREDIEGWRTLQGKTLIKYGPPKKIKNFVDLDGEVSNLKLKYDFWYYDDFSFIFETNYWDYNNEYKFGIFQKMDFPRISKNIEKEYPEYYRYEPKGEFIDFIFDDAGFRGSDGKTRTEIYYGIPINKLHYQSGADAWEGKVRTGVFLHNENWERILTDVQVRDIQFEADSVDTSSTELTTGQFTYMIEPGNYNLNLEIQDQLSENEGTSKNTLTVESYGYEKLQLSDIIPAYEISLLPQGSEIRRENLAISPNPDHAFLLSQSIYIYYEIYNLILDNIPGNSSYTVEYKLRYLEEDRPWIVNFVRKLIVNEQLDQGITTQFENRGSAREESQFIRIDHSLTKPGPYELQVLITDKLSGDSVGKSVQLQLFAKK